MAESKPFDPAQHLTSLKGRQYLEVKWRLVWLRSEHPDASIETELITYTPDVAVLRARVSIPNGGSATGLGSETPAGFGDYLEKAETRAIGRALGALGYGTQFCADFDELPHIADSPVRPGPALSAPAPGQTLTMQRRSLARSGFGASGQFRSPKEKQ